MTNVDSVQINASFLVVYNLKLKAKPFEKNLNKQIKSEFTRLGSRHACQPNGKRPVLQHRPDEMESKFWKKIGHKLQIHRKQAV